MELDFVKFIKELPPRHRTFYLLMRSYERDLNAISTRHSINNEHTKEILRSIATLYESELLPLIEYDTKSPIYDNQLNRNENAEPSSSESIVKPIESQTVFYEFDEFAENLGPWASSFSSKSEQSLPDVSVPNLVIELSPTVRSNNDSDLSSSEE